MIKKYWRSFSLRSAVIIFIAFCGVLLGVQLIVYAQEVKHAEQTMLHAVASYKKDLLTVAAHLSNDELVQHVQRTIEESTDENLIVALASPAAPNTLLVGNIDAWPALPPTAGVEWYQFLTSYDNHATPAQVQGQIVTLQNGWQALIGYDLSPLEEVQQSLWYTLAENVAYALLAACMLSTVLVVLLNRHLRRLNNAFTQIKHGHLSYRMAVHNSGDEFDRLAQHFNATMDWLNTLLLMIQESSNAVAHDMRTPLSRLRLELTTLLAQPHVQKNTRTALRQHIQKLDDLIAMFDNILNIAKAETRGSRALFQQINFIELVQNIVDFYQPLIDNKHITLHSNFSDSALYLYGDKQLLSQAIVNILDNACKYTLAHGSILIEISATDGNIMLCVHDTGGGVPDDLLPKLCERFVRADSSRHTQGHGLGLSLVQAVAHLHSGTLALSNAAQGLRVVLQLPASSH